jgi:hypothetical protein
MQTSILNLYSGQFLSRPMKTDNHVAGREEIRSVQRWRARSEVSDVERELLEKTVCEKCVFPQ